MKVDKLSKQEIYDAVVEGVDRAMWRMITGVTDMPSTEFWESLDTAMEKAFTKIAEDEIERRRDE